MDVMEYNNVFKEDRGALVSHFNFLFKFKF